MEIANGLRLKVAGQDVLIAQDDCDDPELAEATVIIVNSADLDLLIFGLQKAKEQLEREAPPMR